jgi:hypothetical protein
MIGVVAGGHLAGFIGRTPIGALVLGLIVGAGAVIRMTFH